MPIENGELKIGDGAYVINVDRVGNAGLGDAFGISQLIADAALEEADLETGLGRLGITEKEDLSTVITFLGNALAKNKRREEEHKYKSVKFIHGRLQSLLGENTGDSRPPDDDAPGKQGKDTRGRKSRAGGYEGDTDW